jgi:hypothetical protein
MVNPNRFYTYAYLREDRTPYYIGKGSGKRIFEKRKRCCRPPKDKSRIIFLKQNITEEEAFKHEIYMIAVFGRKDLGTGILHNRTDGGEGKSGWVASEETRRKMSESGKVKIYSEEHRKKIGESNKRRIVSEETRRKMSERIRSEETRRKMSESGKVKIFSEEHRRKMTEATQSKETRKKMSEAKKGKSLMTNSQKWECCETGYVSTAAGVVSYQKGKGMDTSKSNRKQISTTT